LPLFPLLPEGCDDDAVRADPVVVLVAVVPLVSLRLASVAAAAVVVFTAGGVIGSGATDAPPSAPPPVA
jgi:hypothetical protein